MLVPDLGDIFDGGTQRGGLLVLGLGVGMVSVTSLTTVVVQGSCELDHADDCGVLSEPRSSPRPVTRQAR